MNREQLEHVVRAAGSIVGEERILVIGSQSILASRGEDELPPEATASNEVDIAFFDDPHEQKSDLIDGSIGEQSPFHQSFGYYAQGVSTTTAILPEGWRDRLVPLANANTGGVTAWCLEAHDLCVAKLSAARSKDITYCHALVTARLVDIATLRHRLTATELASHRRDLAEGMIRRVELTLPGSLDDQPPTTK